jgi:hypothetical protein
MMLHMLMHTTETEMPKANAKELLSALWKAAEAEGNEDAQTALIYAEQNAHETVAENPDEVYDVVKLTLGSIASTAPFCESREVSDWFERHGYGW